MHFFTVMGSTETRVIQARCLGRKILVDIHSDSFQCRMGNHVHYLRVRTSNFMHVVSPFFFSPGPAVGSQHPLTTYSTSSLGTKHPELPKVKLFHSRTCLGLTVERSIPSESYNAEAVQWTKYMRNTPRAS